MTINSAQPQLLDLAGAMRGQDWADDLAGALIAARNAGWDWPKAFLAAARLMADETAHPRDLTVSLRDPKSSRQDDPSAIDRGRSEFQQAKAALFGTREGGDPQ